MKARRSRGGRALLIVALCVSTSLIWACSAYAFDPTEVRETPRTPLDETRVMPRVQNKIDENLAAFQDAPDYAPSAGSVRAQLNTDAYSLGGEVGDIADSFGRDGEAEDLIRDCAKNALSDLVNNIIGDATNGGADDTDDDQDNDTDEPFDIGQEFGEEFANMPSDMANCLMTYTGTGNDTANAIADAVTHVVGVQAVGAYQLDPDVANVVDFLAVANWYTIRQ